MVRQGELFPSPGVTVVLDKARGEPRVWVRRLVIWEKPGEIIREIHFRRGLNIIWSPDPGASTAELGRDAGSGHGAGKTLLCRLLRYCLSEATFATTAQRASIAGLLPAGLVGAELMIEGHPWAVIRPIGQTRKQLVRIDATLEELAESKEAGTGIQPLLEALAALFPDGIDDYLPEEKESTAWPFALAWLSRDQECRFDHLLDWRHKRADSASVAISPSKDQLLVVVRAFLGVIEQQELSLKAERLALSEKKRALDRDLTYFQRRTAQVGSELVGAFGPDSDSINSGELALAAFQEKAESKLRQIEQNDSGIELLQQMAPYRERREGVLQEKAVVGQEVNNLNALLELHQEQLKVLRGERSNLDAAELKVRLGPVCPVCRVPIDRALADGCNLSHVFRDPVSIADEKRDVAQQTGDCNEGILRSQRLIAENQSRVQALEREERELAAKIESYEKEIEKSRRQRRQQWFDTQQLLKKISEQQSMKDDIGKASRSLEKLGADDDKLSNLQTELRNQHNDTLSRFGDLFSYVCRGLLGNQVPASLTLTGQGLQADVGVGGMAMESLKVIAFDLAALLMSVEGRSTLPAFLIHDSPREADLGEAHYHCLFRLVERLEALSDAPPFQYVITTTTQPPGDMCQAPYLIAELHGSDVDGRLLRRHLG